jgi:hypothetical protein
MTGFHRWLSTDGDEDQCIGCGVASPDFGEGVVSDHGPLPIGCPGPDVAQPHHFTHSPMPDTIECAYCTVVIGPTTLPSDVDWECHQPR